LGRASALAQDFAVITDDGGRVYVLLSLGDGTFGPLSEVATIPVSNNRGAAGADFDGDGARDFVTADATGNTVTPHYHRGVGDGTFDAPIVLPSTPEGRGRVQGMCAADFDGDGNVDFAVNDDRTAVGFYWGSGDGTFVQETRTFPGNGRALDAGDFDEDGNVDFVRATFSNGEVRLYLGGGDRTFTEAPALVGDAGGDPYTTAAGDLDCDGHLDVLANAGGSGTFLFYRGRGDGTFEAGVE